MCHKGTGLCVSTRHGKSCNVLTDDASTCKLPKASVYDHHDGNALKVTETKVLYIASWPRQKPAQLFIKVKSISFKERGEYILYYDAVDRAGNRAEQLPFGMIMQDHVKPTMKIGSGITLQSCDVRGVRANPDRRQFSHLHHKVKLLATDNYDGDVTDQMTVTVRPPSKGCGHLKTTVFKANAPIVLDTYCVGKYTVEYTARDYADMFGLKMADNVAKASITVSVVDTHGPVISCDKNGERYKSGWGTIKGAAMLATTKIAGSHKFTMYKTCRDNCVKQRWERVVTNKPVAACQYFEFNQVARTCTLYATAPTGFDSAPLHSQNWQGRLLGCAVPTLHECKTKYKDAGAVCVDVRDSATAAGGVDQKALSSMLLANLPAALQSAAGPATGKYNVHYQSKDRSGNKAATNPVRVVKVVDTQAPNKFLVYGNNVVQLEHRVKNNLPELKALMQISSSLVSCSDVCDGDLTHKVTSQIFKGNCDGVFLEHKLGLQWQATTGKGKLTSPEAVWASHGTFALNTRARTTLDTVLPSAVPSPSLTYRPRTRPRRRPHRRPWHPVPNASHAR